MRPSFLKMQILSKGKVFELFKLKFARSHVIIFPETFIKIRKIVETAGEGGFCCGYSLCEKEGGLIQTVLVEVLIEGSSAFFFEIVHKM